MNDILKRYGNLLIEVDLWFDACLSRHPEKIVCHHGCSSCCRGLFDITLLDALYLKCGFDLMPLPVQRAVQEKATRRLRNLASNWPEFTKPWVLNHIPENIWDAMMPEDDETPCPLLSDNGACLVYAHRPMTCRLNGIPLIDVNGEHFFDEWCTLNFTDIDPTSLEDIRHPFSDLFTQELLLFRELASRLFNKQINEIDTIIPAAVFMNSAMLTMIQIHPAITNNLLNGKH